MSRKTLQILINDLMFTIGYFIKNKDVKVYVIAIIVLTVVMYGLMTLAEMCAKRKNSIKKSNNF